MSVMNMKPIIRQIVLQSDVKKCLTTYPDTFNDLPIAVYSTETTAQFIDNEKEEYRTLWKVTIDLIGTGKLTDIAMDICSNLRKNGFVCRSQDANIDGLSRVIITATVLVDNNLNMTFNP